MVGDVQSPTSKRLAVSKYTVDDQAEKPLVLRLEGATPHPNARPLAPRRPRRRVRGLLTG